MPQTIRELFKGVGWIYADENNVLKLTADEEINFFLQNIQVDTHRQGNAAQIKIRNINAEKIIYMQNNSAKRTFFAGEICVSPEFGEENFNSWLRNENKTEHWIVFLEGMTEVRSTPSVRPIILQAKEYFCNNSTSVSFKWLCNDTNIVFNSATVFRNVEGSESIIKNYIELFDNRPYRGLNIKTTIASGANNENESKKDRLPLQLIYYGAPGTGKSYATNDAIKKYSTIRTTFHPDSDYATFVGAYKPTMATKDCYGLCGKETVKMKDNAGADLKENTITYTFVKQAFLKAYVNAWKLWVATCEDGKELEPQFLVIEEINRGNCAQIFGDLFQLLDRKNGFSEYPIEADNEICKSLLDDDTDENPSFGRTGLLFTDEQKALINTMYDKNNKPSNNVADKIAKGQLLVLPPNFYIWATMNTSDQSLLPMDSAFKRRWKWKYIPIEQAEIGLDGNPRKWKIEADGHYCYWWEFLQAINDEIEDVSHSEDKQLGYYFCKPENGEYITAKDFVSKVIFYLWNDVFKDEDSSIFHYKELDGLWNIEGFQPNKENFYFRNFITSKESVDEKLIRWFINNLLQKKGISLLDDIDQNPISEGIAYMRRIKNDETVNPSEDLDDTRSENLNNDDEVVNASV